MDDLDKKGESSQAALLITGVALALITQNQDPEGMGRVQVTYPWDVHPHETYWARICVPLGSKGRNFIPNIGNEVLIAFEHGDPQSPYVLGTLWNAVK